MTCCVTGHRPKGFPFPRDSENFAYCKYLDELEAEIERVIREGCCHFISGMADGADIDYANTVLMLRNNGKPITFEAALPYPIVPTKPITAYTAERDMILLQCNKKQIVSPHYHKGCFMQRNRYMVDQSDWVIAIWNKSHQGGTWNTIQYARNAGKSIRYIYLDEFSSFML